MPIVATDIIVYASANMPDTDSGTNGGAIDALRRIVFDQIAANDDVEAVSSNAGDTMNATVEGRSTAGAVVSETKALTGTTAAIFSTISVIERVLKFELASAPAGNVTLRRSVAGTSIGVVPAGERGFLAMFRKILSDPSTTKNYYAKAFVKNAHATLSLLTTVLKQNTDTPGRITHLLATAVNDTATAADRVTAPAAGDTQNPDTFDDTDKTVPGTDLAAGAAIGVWFRAQLPAGDSPNRTTYVLEVTGATV